MLGLIALVLTAAPAAAQPIWSEVTIAGWTADSSAVAWEGAIYSQEKPDGVSPCELRFLVVADDQGRIQRIFRVHRWVPMDEVTWADPNAESLWQSAASEDAGKRWRASHSLGRVSSPREIVAKVEDKGGREPLTIKSALTGKGCKLASLIVALGTRSAELMEDRCSEEGGPCGGVKGRVQLAWANDGARAALGWNVTRVGEGRDEVVRGHFAVVSPRSLASVDLLDAGAGGAVSGLAERLTGAGFRLAHQGKAGTPRKATEIYFAPGFEPEAKEVAVLVGATPEAVKPLSWKSPYAITVAAGAGK